MMRKTLFSLSVAALALTGCSQNELIGDQGTLLNSKDRSISFGSYLARPTSRATGVNLAEFQTNGQFKVWGYVTTDAAGASADINVAENIALHTTLSGGAALDGSDLFKRMADPIDGSKYIWGSTKNQKYYWPTDGLGKMSFYALSHTVDFASAAVTSLTAPTQSIGAQFSYTVGSNGTKADEDKQEDLMGAQVYNMAWSTDRETSKVLLDFKHLLTQVRFSAKASDASYRVKILSLKITGANNEGTFTFDPSATAATPIGSWAIADATKRADYTYFDATAGTGAQAGEFPKGFPKENSDPAKHFIGTTEVDFPLFGVDDVTQALIVLPSVAMDGTPATALGLKGVKIEVAYECYILSGVEGEDGADVAHWTTDGTILKRTIELTEKEMWTMNKKVCYALTLFNSNAGMIEYNPIASEWTPQGGNSNLYPDKDYVSVP